MQNKKSSQNLLKEEYKFFYVKEDKTEKAESRDSSKLETKVSLYDNVEEVTYPDHTVRQNLLVFQVIPMAIEKNAYAFQKKSGGPIYVIGTRLSLAQVVHHYPYEKTAIKKFEKDPNNQIAFYTSDGFLFIVDKKKYQIIGD